jgi:aldose 1-epimerase
LFGALGIGMEIETNCRAVQLYTANFLTPRTGKGGASYGLFGAVCLETEGRQAMPDQPIAAENVLQPGEAGTPRETKYRFIIKED